MAEPSISEGAAGTIGVVGAGTMGGGIAELAALGGFVTKVYDPLPAAPAEALGAIAERLAANVQRGRLSENERRRAIDLLSPAAEIEDLAGCDFLIEAAPESLELKRDVLARLASACGPDAILASNTSSLRIADLAAAIERPGRVLGLHFFNPPTRMRLVEVVAAPATTDLAAARAREVATAMGRTPVLCRDLPGFVANRLARPFYLEALRMLATEVGSAEEIDAACRLGLGFPMGPFELLDLIGLDVNLMIARSLFEQAGRPERWRPGPIQERLVEAGALGRKSGRGFYEYPRPRPEVREAVVAVDAARAALAGLDPRPAEILARLLAQIANEAAFALEEEVAAPADLDLAMRLGFNWPLGPLALAEVVGPAEAVRILLELETHHGEAYAVAPLLAAVGADPSATSLIS